MVATSCRQMLRGAIFALVAGVGGVASSDGLAAGGPGGPAVASGSPSCGYRRGFFLRDADGRGALRLNGRVQGRLEVGGEGGDVLRARLLLRRVRLALKGFVWTPALTYKVQVGLGEGRVSLKDGWVQYALSPRWARLRVGQFKRPFSRQQLTSSGRQAFVDRAPTDEAFGAGRDVGLMVASAPKAAGLELAAGLFNGTGAEGTSVATVEVDPRTGVGRALGGERSNVPDVFHPAAVVRLGYQSSGVRGYSEGDLQGGGWRFGVAASGRVDFDNDGDGANLLAGEVDCVVKVHGLDATGGLYAQRRVASRGVGGERSVASVTDLGGHVQAGYVIAGRVQPSVRYAVVAPGDSAARREVSAAVSVFGRGHALKWQTDATWGWGGPGEGAGWDVRSQVQLAF